MAWTFSSDRAVYMQIAEKITRSILSGEYTPGKQIPSVRQLAMEAAVNPNTVQRAFTELENTGIIISKGTVGRYVTENTETIEVCRKKMAEDYTKNFLENITQLSITKEQVLKMIKEVNI